MDYWPLYIKLLWWFSWVSGLPPHYAEIIYGGIVTRGVKMVIYWVRSNFNSSSDSEWLSGTDEIIKVTLSNMKYATNFHVTINRNSTISLFDTGATISWMSKACFDTLQPKPKLMQKTYRVNGTNWNSLGPIGTTTCILKFPKKFQQQFIIWKKLLWPVVLGLDFSHDYLIEVDWFSSDQLNLHQGPKSL